MKKQTYNIIELCSGLGAISEAFKRRGHSINILGYGDISKVANKAFKILHKDSGVELGDVLSIDRDWWKQQSIDILSFGFPCQDISQYGYQRGMKEGSNTRSSIAWNINELININKPRAIIIENVANLLGKNHIEDFELYVESIRQMGYSVKYSKAKGSDFNVPQLRDRVFIVCTLKELYPFSFHEKVGCTKTLMGDVVDSISQKEWYYIKNPQYLEKWKHMNNIIAKKENRNISFTIPHCYANRGVAGITYIYDKSTDRFRILTEKEVGRLMGWHDDRIEELIQSELTPNQIYGLFGNSIIVDVVENFIVDNLINSLKRI